MVNTCILAKDRFEPPPVREVAVSPAAKYELVISMEGAPEEWIKKGSKGKLVHSSEPDSIIWEQSFAHNYRPRYAVVNDEGRVALFDQWINVRGPHAITVFNLAGEIIATYSFTDIVALLSVSPVNTAKKAKYGSWMSSLPDLSANGDCVNVDVAGEALSIILSTGKIKKNNLISR